MNASLKKKVVDPRFAKSKEYASVISTIADKGKCPFCKENFLYHKNPILKKVGGWFITASSWPYKNSAHHFLIIGSRHKEQFSELSGTDFANVTSLVSWATKKNNIRGGALTLRFGETQYTGATVCHLHFHLIVPKLGRKNASKTVNFPIG